MKRDNDLASEETVVGSKWEGGWVAVSCSPTICNEICEEGC